MATKDPAADVAAALATAGYGTVGTDLFRGPVRPPDADTGMPTRAIFVVDGATGGPEPVGVFGDPALFRRATVQVTVRHEVYDTGDAQAEQIYDTLAAGTLAGGYLALMMLNSQPLFLGQDRSSWYTWTINVEAHYEQT